MHPVLVVFTNPWVQERTRESTTGSPAIHQLEVIAGISPQVFLDPTWRDGVALATPEGSVTSVC